jgi:hypothetical protein
MTAAIGTTVNALVELSSLGIPEPKTDWRPGTETRKLHSGRVKWIGPPTGSWSWGFLTQAQRNALRQKLPLASNAVYIHHRTRENSDEWKYYQVEAVWPEEPREPASIDVRINFVVEFTVMVEVAGP